MKRYIYILLLLLVILVLISVAIYVYSNKQKTENTTPFAQDSTSAGFEIASNEYDADFSFNKSFSDPEIDSILTRISTAEHGINLEIITTPPEATNWILDGEEKLAGYDQQIGSDGLKITVYLNRDSPLVRKNNLNYLNIGYISALYLSARNAGMYPDTDAFGVKEIAFDKYLQLSENENLPISVAN